MHPYVLLLAGSCVVSAICAGGIYSRSPGRRESRLAALLFLGASFWAMCEAGWNLAPDREQALWLIKLSASGWIFIGPLVLHLFLHQSGDQRPSQHRLMKRLYAACGLLLVMVWTTSWMVKAALRTSWGFGFTVGPVFPVFYAITMVGVLRGIMIVRDISRSARSPAERRQRPWLYAAVGIPLVVASATDVVLPVLGIHVPRLGSTSFAILGVISLYVVLRWGYSLLSPGTFADEILATLPDGVALLHLDQRIRVSNSGLVRLSEHPKERLRGMPIGELLSWSFDDLSEGADEVDCELTRASGDRIPVTISSSVLRDREGQAMGLVLVVRDLREVAELRSRLVMSARLAAVGELAAGVAHEINNPIAFVRANLGQLHSHWKLLSGSTAGDDAPPDAREMLLEGDELIEESIEGIDRAAEIVRGVKGFAHRGSGVREPTDLNLLLDDVLYMADTQLRERAQLERIFSPLPPVSCVPQELKQVFLNVILNAGQAIEDGGMIRVCTESGEGEVVVSISDDGCGIPPEIMDRIFDPFFTTKGVGEGTGLGLGIAYQIVRSHGGEIRVESEPGQGTTFSVRLPLRP